jgi:hypothetical protein
MWRWTDDEGDCLWFFIPIIQRHPHIPFLSEEPSFWGMLMRDRRVNQGFYHARPRQIGCNRATMRVVWAARLAMLPTGLLV